MSGVRRFAADVPHPFPVSDQRPGKARHLRHLVAPITLALYNRMESHVEGNGVVTVRNHLRPWKERDVYTLNKGYGRAI